MGGSEGISDFSLVSLPGIWESCMDKQTILMSLQLCLLSYDWSYSIKHTKSLINMCGMYRGVYSMRGVVESLIRKLNAHQHLQTFLKLIFFKPWYLMCTYYPLCVYIYTTHYVYIYYPLCVYIYYPLCMCTHKQKRSL